MKTKAPKQLLVPNFKAPIVPKRLTELTLMQYAEKYHVAKTKHLNRVQSIQHKNRILELKWLADNLNFDLNWDEAPVWANYFVMDTTRVATWYESRPKRSYHGYWYCNKGKKLGYVGKIYSPYFRLTNVIKRPVNKEHLCKTV